MSSINIKNDNIETVSGTTGLVGYSTTYISLQAVNGVYINGIGSANTAPTSLPFSNTPGADGFYSGLDNGDFYISGQNGAAVIKSSRRAALRIGLGMTVRFPVAGSLDRLRPPLDLKRPRASISF